MVSPLLLSIVMIKIYVLKTPVILTVDAKMRRLAVMIKMYVLKINVLLPEDVTTLLLTVTMVLSVQKIIASTVVRT